MWQSLFSQWQQSLWLLSPLALIWAARYVRYGRWLTRSPLDLFFLILIVLSVINLLVAPYSAGLRILIGPLWGVTVYYVMVERGRLSDNLSGLVQVLILVSLVFGLQALVATQWNTKSALLLGLIKALPTIRGAYTLEGFNGNEIGGAMAWLAPLMAGLTIYRWRVHGIRWDVTLACLMLVAALILGQNRSAIIGLALGLLLISMTLAKGTLRTVIWGVVIGIVLLQMTLFVDGATELSLVNLSPSTISAENPDSSAAPLRERDELSMLARIQVWLSALSIVRDYPLTGVGLSMYGDDQVRAQYPVTVIEDWVPHHAHNELLQFLTDMGLPGLLPFFGIYIAVGWMLLLAWRQGDAAI